MTIPRWTWLLSLAVLAGCVLAVASCQRDQTRTADRRRVERTDSSAAPAPDAERSKPPSKPVLVDSPTPGTLISSPVRVTGRARGSMYFEAEFPVRLLDDHGEMVGTGVARAQGDWTTPDYVPFEASIVFHPPLTDSTGTLVFEKSNPSGQPEHDAEWRIPVRFR
jgi:hypothetical protein